MRKILALLLVASCSVPTWAGLELRSECGGFTGRSYENGRQLFFESCTAADGTRSRLWTRRGKAEQELTELHYDEKAKKLEYKIGGILVTESNTAAEEARMRAVLELPEAELAHKLPEDLEKLGLTVDSPRMRAIRGNVVGYPEFGLPAPDPDPDMTCGDASPTDCCSEETDCLGCCAYACLGCAACTVGCMMHDLCVRQTGGLCLGLVLVAIAQLLDPVADDICLCP
jgi:hypothetical protein